MNSFERWIPAGNRNNGNIIVNADPFRGSIAIDHLQELNCDYNLLSDKMRAERGRLILFPGDLAEYGTRFSFAPCS